jgi:tumor protein p53-inducible protein 3
MGIKNQSLKFYIYLKKILLKSEWILYGMMGGGNVNGDILSRIMRKRIQLKSSTLRARSDEVFK